MLAFLYSLWLAARRRPFRLRDGRRVELRALVPADRAALRAFFEGLAPRTRQRRFHGAVGALPETLLDHLMRADEHGRAFVATVREAGRERLVGEARFATAADDAPANSAEFALVVADEATGQGLGRHLLDSLTQAAAAAGYARLFGDVAADNRSMLTLAESLGFAVCPHPEDARLVRVVRRVSTPAAAAVAARAARTASLPARAQPSA
jgi:acetyltransferase